MSNIIKSYAVKYELGPTKTIKPKFKEEFVEGIDAVSIKTDKSEVPKEDIQEKTSHMLEQARKEADNILEQAKSQVEDIRVEAYAEGKKKAYEEESAKAKQELDKQMKALEVQEARMKKKYDDMLEELEPTMVKLIGDLIHNITGVLVEDKEEVIIHLIRKGFSDAGKSEEYILKVSSDDFQFVSSKRDYLIDTIGKEANIQIQEDSSLAKNQCLIEDDMKVINCSLDAQLENLMTNLRLLVCL